MMSDELLWRAISGALGAEKTSFLRTAPLHAVMGHYDRGEEFTLAHAAGHLSKAATLKAAENAAIFDGIAALRSVTQKHAGKGGALGGLTDSPLLRDVGKKMLGGAAVAGGAAVPTYMVGSALSDKATEDARNRALQTAAGVGGMAMLGYGAKKLMDGPQGQ